MEHKIGNACKTKIKIERGGKRGMKIEVLRGREREREGGRQPNTQSITMPCILKKIRVTHVASRK
jgi:hypothetical protein